jgi:uncharacterized protein (TIGR00255 family)
MIVSMTGFGDATGEHLGTLYAVEIRSLNNRYFKATIKLPEQLLGLEPEIEVLLRDRLGRGSITFILKSRSNDAAGISQINPAVLESYAAPLRKLVGSHPQFTLDAASLLTLPGVLQTSEDSTHLIEQHGPVVRQLALAAIDKLLVMRQREGQVLFDDLDKHLSIIETALAQIETRAPGVVSEYQKRLTSRVNELISRSEIKVSEADLLKEIAVFAERSDISEEITRLRHHCKHFRDTCAKGEHAGRKLDFIAQEMLREANTIASKGGDAEIAGHIVDVKGAIDRVKEQVQNVE